MACQLVDTKWVGGGVTDIIWAGGIFLHVAIGRPIDGVCVKRSTSYAVGTVSSVIRAIATSAWGGLQDSH